MPWTTAARANEWVKGVDLGADPAALNESLSDAQLDLYGRLIQFIAKATVDTWTDTTDTPERIQYWTARLTAAIYLSKFQGYHLQPEIPDNPAAKFYADVLAEVKNAKYGTLLIVDVAGARVPVSGISVSTPRWRFIEYLPTHEGGEIDP